MFELTLNVQVYVGCPSTREFIIVCLGSRGPGQIKIFPQNKNFPPWSYPDAAAAGAAADAASAATACIYYVIIGGALRAPLYLES